MGHALRYDWNAIQKYYDDGHSIRECYDRFGFGRTALTKAQLKGRFKSRTLSESRFVAVKSGRHKQKWTEEARNKMREMAIKRKLGGNRNSHRLEYRGIIMESSYELRVAKIMDLNNIQWNKTKTRFYWIDENGIGHYYKPDFFLPAFGIYLDPKHKGLINLHRNKIIRVQEQNGIRVLVVPIDIIEKWELYGFDLTLLGL